MQGLDFFLDTQNIPLIFLILQGYPRVLNRCPEALQSTARSEKGIAQARVRVHGWARLLAESPASRPRCGRRGYGRCAFWNTQPPHCLK